MSAYMDRAYFTAVFLGKMAVSGLSDEAARLLSSFEQALAAADAPAAAGLHFRSAQVLLATQPPELEPAGQHLQRALALDPSDDEAFRLLMRTLLRTGRKLELAQACEEAAREAPAGRRAERLLLAAELYDS